MALNTSLAVPEHNQRTFAKNWDHEVQQRISKLRGKFTVKEFEGKEHVFSDLDDVEFSEDAGRLSRSNPTEWTGKKRKIVKRNFDVQKLFDKNDAEFLGMLNEPTSELSRLRLRLSVVPILSIRRSRCRQPNRSL